MKASINISTTDKVNMDNCIITCEQKELDEEKNSAEKNRLKLV